MKPKMHPKGDQPHIPHLSIQDMCDGMTDQQLKERHRQQDTLVRSARERVLSARSSISPSVSMRDISRLSVRGRPGADDTEDVRSYAGDVDEGFYTNNHHSEYSTPDLYSDSGSSFSHITRAKTVPDAEMLKPEFRIDERPELKSYNSFTGDLPRKRLCMRSKSAVSREFDSVVSLSRQCCDVLGPKVCHQCGLYRRRLMDATRHESPLSRLHTSERNFADSIVLSRTLPDLSTDEIEDKMMSGEISRISLRERIYLKRERTMQEKAAKARHKEYVREKGKTWNGVSSTFFMNIRDLNQRVLVGKLSNNLSEIQKSGSRWAPIQHAVKQTQEMSITEKLLPGFRSSRAKTAPSKKTKLVDKYEPPLLPRVCQNVSPSFFAGSANAYELPDRLPDKVVDDQVDDFSAFDPAWSRSTSRSQSAANEGPTSEEPGPELADQTETATQEQGDSATVKDKPESDNQIVKAETENTNVNDKTEQQSIA